MNRLFLPYLNKNVLIYLDDILIFSKTEEEHYAHLSHVQSCLRQGGQKAKMSKCDFFKAELKFLGHIVSSSGMKPDPAKVQVVVDRPVPQTTFEVRSFLGLKAPAKAPRPEQVPGAGVSGEHRWLQPVEAP
jgi:hypothetical protein